MVFRSMRRAVRGAVTGRSGLVPSRARTVLSRRGRLGAAGAGAVVVGAAAAGWAVQHRAVARSSAGAVRGETGEFTMPDGLTHHRIDVDDGGSIHAVEIGTGPAIVLVHGVTLAAEVWCRQLQVLGATHRVIAVDVRGHGQSVAGHDGFTGGMARLASDLRQVFDALDVESAVLVGHSMGGMIALQLVVDAPPNWTRRRIGGLALVDTSAGPLAGSRGLRLVQRPTAVALSRTLLLADALGVSLAQSADFRWWSARFVFGADPDPAQVAFAEALGSATPTGTLAGLLSALASFDISARLPDVDLPVLVAVGTHDRLTPPSHARRMADALPRAELVELPRAGHMPMLERPRELARLLDELAGKVHIGVEGPS